MERKTAPTHCMRVDCLILCSCSDCAQAQKLKRRIRFKPQTILPSAMAGRLVHGEGRIYYTMEAGVAGNLKKYIREAKLFPEIENDAHRAGFVELAERVVCPDFLDSAKNATYQPFTEVGVKKQMFCVLFRIGGTVEEELERLAEEKRRSVQDALVEAEAKKLARVECEIEGPYDPYPNQKKGPEFRKAVDRLKSDESVIKTAEEKTTAAVEEYAQMLAAAAGPPAAVALANKLWEHYPNMHAVVDKLYEQVLEATHVGISVTRLDGVDIPYGADGLKEALADATNCPSLYHASRDPAFALAEEMRASGQLAQLGLTGSGWALNRPGMPPFFFGDKTEGHDYSSGGDYAQRMLQGNQAKCGGAHFSIRNRPDAAGLALSGEEYAMPVLSIVRELARQGAAGEPYKLKGGKTYEAVIRFTLDTSKSKLVQGQQRNDPHVGGDRYIGLAASVKLTQIINDFLFTIMPEGFLVDSSFQLHMSCAVVCPKGLPHYKSPAMMRVAAGMKQKGAPVEKLYAAHARAHKRFRAAWSPAITNWDVYEEAAGKYPACKYNHKLVPTLGYKTAVVSPAISTKDVLPSTVYNGAEAPQSLRAMGNDTSIVRWGAGSIREYGTIEGEAISTHITGATYGANCIPDDAQATLLKDILIEFIECMGSEYKHILEQLCLASSGAFCVEEDGSRMDESMGVEEGEADAEMMATPAPSC